MIAALNPMLVVRIFVIFILTIILFVIWIDDSSVFVSIFKFRYIILWVPIGVLGLLTMRPVFRRLYLAVLGPLWWFPDLDGEWEGVVHSNWGRVAAGGSLGEVEFSAAGVREFTKQVRVRITSGLFEFEIELRPDRNDKISRTKFVRPEWPPGERPRLSYIYEQTAFGAVARTDGRRHFGAAMLEYDPATKELRGEYWTQREATKGLNTAGSIILHRREEKESD